MPHLRALTGDRQAVALLAQAAGEVLPLLRASRSVHPAEVLALERLLEDGAAYAAGTLDHLVWRQSCARTRAVLGHVGPSYRAIARVVRAIDLEDWQELAQGYALVASGSRGRFRARREVLERWGRRIADWLAAQPQIPLFPAGGAT